MVDLGMSNGCKAVTSTPVPTTCNFFHLLMTLRLVKLLIASRNGQITSLLQVLLIQMYPRFIHHICSLSEVPKARGRKAVTRETVVRLRNK